MPDNPLLRIGDFARAASLSVKALRAYHEAGLLVPAEVDPETGYRSYSVAQLTDATIIRRLRQLDLPLEAVGQVLEGRDPDVTRKVLGEHGAVLDARLAETQRAIDELTAALAAPALQTPAHLRTEPARVVLNVTTTVTGAEWEPFLTRAHAVLTDAARASGAVVDGPFGGTYPTLIEDDAQDMTAFLPVAAAPLLPAAVRATGVAVGELPATDVAVMAHHGGYDTMDDTYRYLGAWVGEHAQPADLPVRELYLVGPADSDDPADFRTELCWPLLAAGEDAR